MPPGKRENNWIDGLRGIACFIVVTGHLCSSFAPWLHSPAVVEGGPAHVFQLPFFRFCVGERAAVALFFFITGYVNALSPLKKLREGNPENALISLSKSTFNRTGRLVVPTDAAIFFAWMVCQMNAHRLASRIDAWWIRGGTHEPGPTFWESIIRLCRNLTMFWHTGASEYDGTHWTIPFFLKGSMLVYLAVLGTMLTGLRYRKAIIVFLYLWAWSGGGALMEMNVYAGMFLAELTADYGPRATSVLPKYAPSLIILLGLYISSFPEENPDWMPWSHNINLFAGQFIPGGGELSRYVVSVGTTIVVYGVFFSHTARRILSHPFMNFLGRVSFPVYLLHNTLMRTVLAWLIYWRSAMTADDLNAVDEAGNPILLERGGPMTFFFGIPAFYVILYAFAHLWTEHVDSRCMRFVAWMQRKAFGEEEPVVEKGGILNGTAITV